MKTVSKTNVGWFRFPFIFFFLFFFFSLTKPCKKAHLWHTGYLPKSKFQLWSMGVFDILKSPCQVSVPGSFVWGKVWEQWQQVVGGFLTWANQCDFASSHVWKLLSHLFKTFSKGHNEINQPRANSQHGEFRSVWLKLDKVSSHGDCGLPAFPVTL